MSLLPSKPVAPIIYQDPSSLLLIGHHGMGKTTIVSQLDKALLLDFESRSDQVGGFKLDILAKASSNETTPLNIWKAVIANLKAEYKETGVRRFDFCIQDSLSSLERNILIPLGNEIFRSTSMGKAWEVKNGKIQDITTDLKGAGFNPGYMWLMKAWVKYNQAYAGLFKHMIWLGHPKQASYNKGDKEVSYMDLDFTGKLKLDILRKVYAVGFCEKEGDDLFINFIDKSEGQADKIVKTNSPHIYEKKILISSYTPDTGEVNTNWEGIFPHYFSQTTK